MAAIIRDMLSFCLNVRWRSADRLGQERFTTVSRHYPIFGPVLSAAACALSCAAGNLVFRICGYRLLSTAWMIFVFYLIRGIRLFDGFCDMSEGLSYARQRGAETAWDVIHSHSNGAFAILWALILMLGQFSTGAWLVSMPLAEGILPAFACGALSAAGIVFCHTKKTKYNPGSAFLPFLSFCDTGKQIRAAVVSGCCTLPLLLCSNSAVWFHLLIFVLLIMTTILSSRFLGWLIMHELKGFNGDVFGFVSLAQYVLLLSLYEVLYGVVR